MKYFAALLISAVLFVACGDESSSSAPDSIGEISSSSNDDNGSASSSSQKDSKKSSSSVSEKKSSSSVSDKNSSSSVPNPVSSSEESFSGTPCEKDEEGYTVFISQEQVKYICQNGFWIPMSSSSVVQQSSSSKYYDMSRQFNAKLSYGEFTDPRDNHVYKTIRLYDDVTDTLTFFAENLNFGKMISGGNQQGDSTKYCYDDDPWYCENGWGGLYTWSRAMNLPSVCDSVELGSEKCNYTFARDKDGKLIDGEIIHQGICPEGWHIANDGEWAYLQEKSGNSVAHYMGSMVAGFGNNDYGLSILPTGYWEWFPDGTSIFKNIKKQTLFWLPQQDADNADYAKHVNIMSSDMTRGHSRSKYKYAHSIRCVKNY